MAGVIATIPKFAFLDASGKPAVNGTLSTYLAGTTTSTPTYQDQTLTIANTNPVMLDARGECVLWLDSLLAYKFILKDRNGAQQWVQDNVLGAATASSLEPLLANFVKKVDLADTANPLNGAAMVGYGSGTVKDALDSNAASIAENAAAIATNASSISTINTRLKPSLLAPRAKPVGFGYTPGNIWECLTPGQARHDIDLEWEFRATYGSEMGPEDGPPGPPDSWVDAVNGSDSNTGVFQSPFKTLKHAYQNANGTIWLKPGRFTEPFDIRCSDRLLGPGPQARAVMVKAWAGPGTVVFTPAGQQPSEMTWVSSGPTWQATPSGGQLATLILFTNNGEEFPIQYKTSELEVTNSAYGWYQDPTTKEISIRYEGRDLTVDKDKFEIFYETTGNIVLGAKTFLHGITFRGGNQFNAWYQDAVRPIVYAKNCVFEYLQGSNVATQGAIFFTQGCTSRRALVNDGFNYADSIAAGSTPGGVATQALEIDCQGMDNGVPECKSFVVFPDLQARNKQGSSGHESTLVSRINGVYSGNYGQNIADTGINSKTWMIGSICRNPAKEIAGGAGTFGYYDLWTEGDAWLDTVTAGGRLSIEGLHVETGNCKTYRCGFSGTDANIFVGDSATLTGYDALAGEI